MDVERHACSADQAGKALDAVQGALNDIQHQIEKTEELLPTEEPMDVDTYPRTLH
jgi:hypothetical protein